MFLVKGLGGSLNPSKMLLTGFLYEIIGKIGHHPRVPPNFRPEFMQAEHRGILILEIRVPFGPSKH